MRRTCKRDLSVIYSKKVLNIVTSIKVGTFILRERCPYLEFFWSVIARIQTEHGDLLCKSPHLV